MQAIKMNELPVHERPYEKCTRLGPQALQDAELLAVILRTGTKGKSALQLAAEILRAKNGGLLSLYHMSLKELTSIPGVGKVKAVQLKCIGELSKRIARTEAKNQLVFDQPSTIASYFMENLRHEEQEKIYLLMLDKKNHLLGEKCMSVGTVDTSVLSPREILIEALRVQAVNLILLHNHPSGDPTPSSSDLHLTEWVREAADLVGLHLIDHIVIGDHRYVSFRQAGYLPQTDKR